jgi:hypothetical protein
MGITKTGKNTFLQETTGCEARDIILSNDHIRENFSKDNNIDPSKAIVALGIADGIVVFVGSSLDRLLEILPDLKDEVEHVPIIGVDCIPFATEGVGQLAFVLKLGGYYLVHAIASEAPEPL